MEKLFNFNLDFNVYFMETSQMTDKRILRKLLIIISLMAMMVLLSSCGKKEPVTGGDKDPGTTTTTTTTTAPDAGADEPAMIPLPLEVPPAIVEGTPPNLSQIQNMEPQVKTARPAFLVPAGTTNVALNKSVSATDEDPIGGTLSQINDGDMNGSDGSWLEFGLFEQHVTVDLGAEYEIYAIVLWHFHKEERVYFDVVVQIADDPDFITNVEILFNNDTDNTHGLGSGTDKNYVEKAEGKLIEGKGKKTRYVRCYSNGNNANELNHYIEIAVYGKPVE